MIPIQMLAAMTAASAIKGQGEPEVSQHEGEQGGR
jgi:hypothetical protein